MRTRVSHFFAAILALWCVLLPPRAALADNTYLHNDEPVDPDRRHAIPGYAGGLKYKYYEGGWEAVPTPSRQVPYLTGIASRIDLSVADRKVAYALEYEGHLRIDQAAEYTFYVVSDPGCKLWVDGKEVVHNDCSKVRFGFAKPHEASGKITLGEGLHRLHVMFYSDRFTPEPFLEVTYAGSGMERQELGAGVLYHKDDGAQSSVAAKPEASPADKRVLNLTLRTQRLAKDDSGMLYWKTIDAPTQWPADETILIVVDMWNKHWSANGVEAVKEMMPYFNEVVCHARDLGVQIIHSPTAPAMGPYYQHPAYKYMATFPARAVPPALPHPEYPLPLNVDDGGAHGALVEVGTQATGYAQIEGLDIVFEEDGVKDGICEPFGPAWNLMQAKGIRNVIITGCATNMCVMGKPLGIRNWVQRGIHVVLVRDLTRPMYNPASPPYVNMNEATWMMTEYIEKFWCPTVGSEEILKSAITQP